MTATLTVTAKGQITLRKEVEAGLAMLEDGGDFADGVIAFEGCRLGGTVFASFDRTAIRFIAARVARRCCSARRTPEPSSLGGGVALNFAHR